MFAFQIRSATAFQANPRIAPLILQHSRIVILTFRRSYSERCPTDNNCFVLEVSLEPDKMIVLKTQRVSYPRPQHQLFHLLFPWQALPANGDTDWCILLPFPFSLDSHVPLLQCLTFPISSHIEPISFVISIFRVASSMPEVTLQTTNQPRINLVRVSLFYTSGATYCSLMQIYTLVQNWCKPEVIFRLDLSGSSSIKIKFYHTILAFCA